MSVLEAEAPVSRNDHAKFHKLIATAQKHAPVKVAVAHPCDQVSLESVIEAANLKLIEPILVGPEQRIREVAAKHALDISRFEIVDAEYSQESAEKAVALVREGRAEEMLTVGPGPHEVRVEVTWEQDRRVSTKVVDVAPAATGLLEIRVGRMSKDLKLEWSRLAKD